MEPLPETLFPRLAEELREQVNHLSAAAQLLTPVVREQGETRYDQYLAILNQSIYRLIRTINHLEYLQLPEDESSACQTALDLAGLCRQTAEQVDALAGQMGVRFRYEEERASLLTCGDAQLLRRLLLNLISNALHWAGEGGEAGMRFTGGRERAIITVWDNGPGLQTQKEGREHLLEPTAGPGLGLPVARRIAAFHGGTLVFEQREDRGLRAILSLPVRVPEGGCELRSPQMGYDASGGFSTALVELSGVLPFSAFLPEDVE